MSELRDEVLAGLSGRRVSTALFVIERRTAFLALQARHAAAPAICGEMVEQRERAFLAALASGRDLAAAPSIQQLERFAPQWAHLVPAGAAMRADLARRLGAKYRFRTRDVPRMRAALEPGAGAILDEAAQPGLGVRERLRWTGARLGRRLTELPPFWAAFGLTLTATVGAGTLALPIALAGLTPLVGVGLIVVLGLMNVLTVAAVAESLTRVGGVRWGGAHLGRVVGQLLGPGSARVFTGALFVFSIVVLLAYYVGFATTLATGTPVPAPVWAGLLFVVVLAGLRRGSLDATVASALLVGGVNIFAIVALSGLALSRFDPANLQAAAPLAGVSVLQLVFGVVLVAFFGHTSIASCAAVVLRRDPGGRSLVRGAAVATVAAVVLYALWTAAIRGAVGPDRLAAEAGTALAPLAEVAGLGVLIVGGVFAVLAMGMAAVNYSLGLYHQAGPVPIAGAFAIAEALLLARRESFAGSLGLLGTVTVPLLGGIFPVLLLAAARRRGEYVPSSRPRWLGSRAALGAVYAVFLAAVLAHGLVIWQAPAARALALGVAVVIVVVTAAAVRGRRFRPRAVAELRRDAELGLVRLQLTAAGEPLDARVTVRGQDGGEAHVQPDAGVAELPPGAVGVVLDLPLPPELELYVWAHEVDAAGTSVPLATTSQRQGTVLEVTWR